jgi:hypothetical protein
VIILLAPYFGHWKDLMRSVWLNWIVNLRIQSFAGNQELRPSDQKRLTNGEVAGEANANANQNAPDFYVISDLMSTKLELEH